MQLVMSKKNADFLVVAFGLMLLATIIMAINLLSR